MNIFKGKGGKMETLFSAEEINRLNEETPEEELKNFFKDSLTDDKMSVEEAKEIAQKWAKEMSKNKD